MRKYDVLCITIMNSWMVIFRDPGDYCWYVFQDHIEDSFKAEQIANAMNLAANR